MNKKMFNIALLLLALITILDPTGKIFHSKTIIFVIVFSFKFFLKKKIGSKDVMIVTLFICINMISIFIGSQNKYFDFQIALGVIKAFSFLLLLLVLDEKDRLLDKMMDVLFILASVILLLFILFKFTGIYLEIYRYFTTEKETIMIAYRNIGGMKLPMFFHKSSPLLIFLFSRLIYDVFIYKKNQKIKLIIVSLAIFLSGTRSLYLSMVVIVFIIYAINLVKKKKFMQLNLLVVMAFFIGIKLLNILIMKSDFESTMIKYESLGSYLNHITFWGEGVGSGFFNEGRKKIVYISELTYFEMFRRYGFLWSVPLTLFLINPLRRKKLFVDKLSYLIYLVIGGTNPLIFSSTGFLIIIALYKEKKEGIK